jgi:hypothetical protein
VPGLGLDITSLTRPGRKPSSCEGVFVRELGFPDLPLLATSRGTEPPELKRITERHHAMARALAQGLSEGEVSAMVGVTQSRLSILKNSPAFKELIELYRANVDRIFQDTTARLAGLAHDAVSEIAERLETKPEEIPLPQLLDIAKMAADRTGLGPTTKQEVAVTNLAERIDAARQRAKALRAPLIEDAQIVDITPVEE